MTADELVEALRPIRLPAAFAEVGLLDVLAAFAAGAIAAYLLLLVLRPLQTRRTDPVAQAQREIDALATLPPQERAVGLARMHARLSAGGPATRPAVLDALLYRPDAPGDFAPLEAAVLQLAGRTGEAAR